MIVTGFTRIAEDKLLMITNEEYREELDKLLKYVQPILNKASVVVIKDNDAYYLYKSIYGYDKFNYVTEFMYSVIPYSDMKKSLLEDYEKRVKAKGEEETPESLAEYLQSSEYDKELNYHMIIDINR